MFNTDYAVLEKYRWSYMTENQLLTRLGRTKDREKLSCFILMAAQKNAFYLEQAGHDRWNFIYADQHYLQRSLRVRRAFHKVSFEKLKIISVSEFRIIR